MEVGAQVGKQEGEEVSNKGEAGETMKVDGDDKMEEDNDEQISFKYVYIPCDEGKDIEEKVMCAKKSQSMQCMLGEALDCPNRARPVQSADLLDDLRLPQIISGHTSPRQPRSNQKNREESSRSQGQGGMKTDDISATMIDSMTESQFVSYPPPPFPTFHLASLSLRLPACLPAFLCLLDHRPLLLLLTISLAGRYRSSHPCRGCVQVSAHAATLFPPLRVVDRWMSVTMYVDDKGSAKVGWRYAQGELPVNARATAIVSMAGGSVTVSWQGARRGEGCEGGGAGEGRGERCLRRPGSVVSRMSSRISAMCEYLTSQRFRVQYMTSHAGAGRCFCCTGIR
eukprot:753542-Hanusia_phi.AAC.1